MLRSMQLGPLSCEQQLGRSSSQSGLRVLAAAPHQPVVPGARGFRGIDPAGWIWTRKGKKGAILGPASNGVNTNASSPQCG